MSRIDNIATTIADAAREAIRAKTLADEMREDATKQAQNVPNARESLMTTLADLGKSDSWTETEIANAITIVSKMQNDAKSAKSVATMLSEVKLAATPVVRGRFAALLAARDAAWGEEDLDKAACKLAKVPFDGILNRVFSRKYQMLVAMLRAINDDSRLNLDTADAVLLWANTKDPNKDPDKLAARIAAACEELAEVNSLLAGRLSVLRTVTDQLRSVGAPEIKLAFAPAPEEEDDSVDVDVDPEHSRSDDEDLDDGEGVDEHLDDGEVTDEDDADDDEREPTDPRQGDLELISTPATHIPTAPAITQNAIEAMFGL